MYFSRFNPNNCDFA